jgi:hypothetical protein
MYRHLIATGILVVLMAGCSQNALTPVPHTANFFHDRYHLEIETTDAFSLTTRQDHRKSGDQIVADVAEYRWGSNTLTIDRGVLTLNGRERASLVPGDRVLVKLNGEVYVNGQQRP